MSKLIEKQALRTVYSTLSILIFKFNSSLTKKKHFSRQKFSPFYYSLRGRTGLFGRPFSVRSRSCRKEIGESPTIHTTTNGVHRWEFAVTAPTDINSTSRPNRPEKSVSALSAAFDFRYRREHPHFPLTKTRSERLGRKRHAPCGQDAPSRNVSSNETLSAAPAAKPDAWIFREGTP